jgi:beta-glucosidase
MKFMKSFPIIASILAILTLQVAAADENPLLVKPKTAELAEAQAIKLLQLMTPEERFDFVRGTGFGIRAVPRLGIPALRFDDASAGMRIQGRPTEKSTAFPCTLLLAATWDAEFARQYGEAVAEEFRVGGSHFILGPGMNLYRNALNGRNFEYLGEDPYLSARVVEAYVRGAQGVNVATTLKHYLCNENENHRKATNSIVEERPLHEIYLPPFEAGVNAGSWGVMTSYNLVNGEWAGQNKVLVNDLLRKGLGYKNLIMTDWTATWYGDRLAKSGVDMEMPDGEALKRDREKLLGSPEIDRMVTTILRVGIASGIYELEAKGEFKKPEWQDKYPAHAQLALAVNHAGIVLLKNTGILPLQAGGAGQILVTGNFAEIAELGGSGSGHVRGYNLKNYLQAIRETFGNERVIYSKTPDDDQIQSASTVLIFTGWSKRNQSNEVNEGEGGNRAFQITEDALIARCTKLNSKTIVTLACGGGVQMDWADQAAGIFMAFYGGQTGADALMDVLTGKVNSSGKLPFTIERNEQDSPAAGEDKDVKPGRVLVDPKDLAVSASKRLAGEFFANKDKSEFYTRDIEYKEGIFVGYRWYDSKKIEPRFPFGYGLSYTTFGYSNFTVANKGNEGVVRLTVKNTGKVAGAEVVQIYVSERKASVERPVRELKGFKRIFLKPGESQQVEVNLNSRAFAFWDVISHDWKVDSGEFVIEAGSSSRDIRATGSLKL